MARIVCRVLGVMFVGIGLMVFLRNAPVDKYHNGLHLVSGLIALGVGFRGSPSGASMYCLGFGAFYLALGLAGLMFGDATMSWMWRVGPMHLNLGDHLFHLVLGPLLIASGLFRRPGSWRELSRTH